MVQVINLGPSRGALQAQILAPGFQALGQGLGEFTGNYFANKTLNEAVSDPEFQNAPLSEQWQMLQGKMSKYGERGQNLLKKHLEVAKQRQLENEQNVLGRYASGEKLSPEDRQGLSVPTQLKMFQFEQKKLAHQNRITNDQLTSQAFSRGYRAILDGDTEGFKEVMSDPDVPLNLKSQLSNIQNQHSTRKDVQNRGNLQRQNLVQGAYAKAITGERSKIGKMGGFQDKEIAEINKRIADLERMRQKDMRRLVKDPESYGSLDIWGSAAGDFLPGHEENGMGEGEEGEPEMRQEARGPQEQEMNQEFAPPQEREKPKVKFDPRNPAHAQRARQVLKEVGGDKPRANAILAKEFIR